MLQVNERGTQIGHSLPFSPFFSLCFCSLSSLLGLSFTYFRPLFGVPFAYIGPLSRYVQKACLLSCELLKISKGSASSLYCMRSLHLKVLLTGHRRVRCLLLGNEPSAFLGIRLKHRLISYYMILSPASHLA